MANTRLVSPGPGVRLLVVFTTIVFAGAATAKARSETITTLCKVFIASALFGMCGTFTTSPAVWQVKYIHRRLAGFAVGRFDSGLTPTASAGKRRSRQQSSVFSERPI